MVRWRIDIEPNNVAQFVNQARVVRRLELAHSVRLQTVGAPDALNRTHAGSRCLRHQGAGPMGRFPGRFFQRQRDDALNRFGAQRLNARGTRLVAKQAVEPFLNETLLPAPNSGLGLGSAAHDLVRADAIGGQQHDLSPPDVLLRRVAVLSQSFEPTNIGGRNGERFSSADLDVPNEPGIPSAISMRRSTRRSRARGKPILRKRSFSIVSMSCFMDRARRSSFQTINVSPLRA